MCYLNKYQWELIPDSLPTVRRNCPKCNEKTNYINSRKFRVNANKSNIDIWAIYKCEKCQSTWNMTIYERIKPYAISKQEYDKFLSNDRELTREYAFNLGIYSKNKAEAILEHINYKLIQTKLGAYYIRENELVIELICKYPIQLRVDKLLSDILGISRSKIKDIHKKGLIFIEDDKASFNLKVRNGIEIHILKALDSIEILEAIV